MAAADTTAVNGALSVLIREMQKQYNHSAVTLSLLRKQDNDTGKAVNWDISTGTALGAYIAEGASQSTFNTYTKSLAVLQTAEYSEGVHITEKAINAAARSGPEALSNLVAFEFGEAVTRLTKKVNQEVISGNTGSALVGLCPGGDTVGGALATSGTYGGISVTGQWASNRRNNPLGAGTLRSLSREEMRQVLRLIMTTSTMKPDLIVCGTIVHLKYGALADAARELHQDVKTGVGRIAIDLGYDALFLNQIPVISDPDFDTLSGMGTKMLFLNRRNVEVIQQPFAPEVVSHPDTVGVVPLISLPEEENGTGGASGITARIKKLPADGGFMKWQLLTEIQLRNRRLNSCGVLADVDNT